MEKESNGVLRDPALERISVHMRKAVSMNRSELGELKALVCRIRKERHQSVSSLSKQQQLFIRKQSRLIPSLLQPKASRSIPNSHDSGKDGVEKEGGDSLIANSTSCPSLPALVPFIVDQSLLSEGRVKNSKGRSSRRRKDRILDHLQKSTAETQGRKKAQPWSNSTSFPSEFCLPPTGILSLSVNQDHHSETHKPRKSEMDTGILRLQQITVDEDRVKLNDRSGQQWAENINFTHAVSNPPHLNTEKFCAEQPFALERGLRSGSDKHGRDRSLSEVTRISESGLLHSIPESKRRKSAREHWKTVRDSLRGTILRERRGLVSPLERMHCEIRQCRYIRKHPKQQGDDEKDETSMEIQSEHVKSFSTRRCPCYLCATSKVAPLP